MHAAESMIAENEDHEIIISTLLIQTLQRQRQLSVCRGAECCILLVLKIYISLCDKYCPRLLCDRKQNYDKKPWITKGL